MPLIRCGWPFSQSSAFPYIEGSGLLLLPKPWWPLGQSICIGVTRTLVRSADLHFDAIPQRIHRHDQVEAALGSETHANNPHASLFPATYEMTDEIWGLIPDAIQIPSLTWASFFLSEAVTLRWFSRCKQNAQHPTTLTQPSICPSLGHERWSGPQKPRSQSEPAPCFHFNNRKC